MIQHMMPHMIHLWSASKTCYWNFVQTLKVEMKCKHILMFPVVLTSANITSSLYYLLVNLKWCFQTNPKAKTRNTLPFIPNNQEAWHWSHFPLSCFFSFQIMPNPPVKNPMSENAKIILKNTPEIALWLSYFLTTKAVFDPIFAGCPIFNH